MPCRMRNYAEALATYPCSNVFHSGRNLLDEEDRGWRFGHWRRVWTTAEDRSAPRIEFLFVRSFRITVINGSADSWNPCQIPISPAGRNISGIVIQDHRRRQGHVISTIRPNGGIRLVEDEHRQNNSTHDRQPRAFSLHDDRSNVDEFPWTWSANPGRKER